MALNLVLDICLVQPIKVLLLAFTFATLCRPPVDKAETRECEENELTARTRKKHIEFVPLKEDEIPIHSRSGTLNYKNVHDIFVFNDLR